MSSAWSAEEREGSHSQLVPQSQRIIHLLRRSRQPVPVQTELSRFLAFYVLPFPRIEGRQAVLL